MAVDEGQLKQVINNLILNAVQAMPEGGTVCLTGKRVNISPDSEETSFLSPGTYIQISIADQGVGIPPEHLTRIFDPYFTTKPGGSGLGLATAYSIIKNHQGHITVESERGKGTTFHIFLPTSVDRPLQWEAREEDLFYHQGRILVMDDEERVRDTVGEMLAALGYEASFAADGNAAIAKYQQALIGGEPFTAVIIDVTIRGGLGGRATIKKLREIDPEICAIVSSGYTNDKIIEDYQKYGFAAAISKPYNIQTLGRTLRKVLQAPQKG